MREKEREREREMDLRRLIVENRLPRNSRLENASALTPVSFDFLARRHVTVKWPIILNAPDRYARFILPRQTSRKLCKVIESCRSSDTLQVVAQWFILVARQGFRIDGIGF